MDSRGKRAWRSTSAAVALRTPLPMAWTSCRRQSKSTASVFGARADSIMTQSACEPTSLSVGQFAHRLRDGVKALKCPAAQHRFGKLDIELILQGQHHAHRRQRREPGII